MENRITNIQATIPIARKRHLDSIVTFQARKEKIESLPASASNREEIAHCNERIAKLKEELVGMPTVEEPSRFYKPY